MFCFYEMLFIEGIIRKFNIIIWKYFYTHRSVSREDELGISMSTEFTLMVKIVPINLG